MKKKIERKKSGFTLFELLVALFIIGVMASIAIPDIFLRLKNHQLDQNIDLVKQSVKDARSYAIKKSQNIIIDFTEAQENQGDNGGLVKIVDVDNNLISQVSLTKNVLFSSDSNIANDKVYFNFKGEPVDSSGIASNFTDTTNKITIGYFGNSSDALISHSIYINPYTGTIKED